MSVKRIIKLKKTNLPRRRLRYLVSQAIPLDKKPLLSPEQIEKLRNVGEIVLALIAVGALVAVAATMPNMVQLLEKFFPKKYSSRKLTNIEKTQKITQTFYYLKRRKLIKLKMTGQDFKLTLTSLGRSRIKKILFDQMSIPKPRQWDKKWWQVAADIPTHDYKWAADLFRRKIKELRFYPLQRTLWLYPYDPRPEIQFLINHFGIERFVTVMEINRLDQDDEEKLLNFYYRQGILER